VVLAEHGERRAKGRLAKAKESWGASKVPVVAWTAIMIRRIGFFLTFFASIAGASPVDRNHIEVLDSDTIRVGGETFRLIGFDAPETYRARCPSERELGNRATSRLRQLVADGELDLQRIACSCRPG
jgi:endonuclease YncB( thermonuclease family)